MRFSTLKPKLYHFVLFACASLLWFCVACEKILPAAPEDDSLLDGPVDELSAQENARFLAGDVAFNDEVFTPATGLGPFFVSSSCGSCHAGDGKGHPFTTLTRFGQIDENGNAFEGNGGPQLQNRAIPGHTPETLPFGTSFSKFTPPANTGLGFLAALTDEQLLSLADPDDKDNDGISGVPNYIHPPDYFRPQSFHKPSGKKYIGRFGKKAAAIDLLHQTVNAYNQDMGITTDFATDEPSIYNASGSAPDDVPDPEVSASTVQNVVFYLRTLKAPIQRYTEEAVVQEGKELFLSLDCGKCHTPEWTTPQSDLKALSKKQFFPFTDLLLHDMGSGLDDGYTEGTAKTAEWRTPPLWGLGLSKQSQGGQYFLLHDGRAKSIQEAIELHGGEAENSQKKYKKLSESDKQKLLTFLESL